MWFSALIGALFFQFAIFQMTLFNDLSSYFISELGLTTTQFSLVASSYFYAAALSLIPAGLCLDRGNIKRIICVIFGINLLILSTFYLLPSMTSLLAYRLFCGISNSVAFLACMKIMSQLFTGRKLSMMNAIIIAFAMLGGALPSVFEFLLNMPLLHYGLLITLAYGFFYWLLITLTLKLPSIGKTNYLNKQKLTHILQTILTNPINWRCGFYTGLLNLPVTLLAASWGSLYLTQSKHINTIQANRLIGLIFIGMILGSPLIGWISTHLISRKKSMIMGAFFALIIILSIMLESSLSISALAVLFVLLGMVTTTQILSYPMVTEANTLRITGAAMSFVSILIYLIGGSYSELFGLLAGTSHTTLNTAFILLPVAFILAIGVIFSLRDHSILSRFAGEEG